MDPTSKLQSLGFKFEAIPDQRRKGVMVYKIWTARGWTYERFGSDGDVDAWAVNHKPGS